MLYPKNNEEKLSEELFKNPTSEYRGAPFWAWNCKLFKELLIKEIGYLKDMGMGGFHIHCRSGLKTKYLGDEFMELVKACRDEAEKDKMLCWLYDEDRWPSGAAGGLVTKDHKYRARFLVFSPENYKYDEASEDYEISGKAQHSEERTLLAKFEVLIKDGKLAYYKRLKGGEKQCKEAEVWEAYLEVSGDSPWYNNEAYVNTLDKEAIDKFIEITHEKYYKELGKYFGSSIPAIFTDEPQFSHKESLGYASEKKEIILPFTDDFDETYKSAYGYSIIDYIPELIWELPDDKVSKARYHYHDHVCERFTEAFADNIGRWCTAHNIMLTGHMMDEPTLFSQTKALGEAMRSYRAFQLPGIDMLCDWREYSTAKQAQSVAHQYGRPGILSELYGVTNWDFDFRGHKLAGDWQAALGVVLRVHHLTWVSMEGEAKRDYPACIGYQSPWYKEYPIIENHFSRLNTALTRGKPHVKIGVIHPIESYWLHFGPKEQTSEIRDELEYNFNNIIEWLLFGLIDFDFIAESLLPSEAKVEKVSPMKVGEMKYDVIIVPGCETLRSSTVERLEAFRQAGGKVIFMGEAPKLVDAVESDKAIALAEGCSNIPFTRTSLLKSLNEYRDIDIRKYDGTRTDNLFYQMREDGEKRWLFICHVKPMSNPDISSKEKINIRIKGKWDITVYDTMTGEIYKCSSKKEGDYTLLYHEFYQHDSLLLCLEPCCGETALCEKVNSPKNIIDLKQYREVSLPSPVSIALSEPNVLLMDMAEYSFDDGEWMPEEELLRIDNLFRKKLNFPLRMHALAQPWISCDVEEPALHKLKLRFKVFSEVYVKKPYMAMENPEAAEIFVNGTKLKKVIDGWYVDECIKRVQLPDLDKGITEIILSIPFTSKTNVEWCYLLGDFGVMVNGSHSSITEPVSKLHFGDFTKQGLPFYAGNVTYKCNIKCEKGSLVLEASHFRAPLLSVKLDGEEKGKLAFAPYTLNLGNVSEGEHTIEITAFGNRINAFGTVHNSNYTTTWFGPDAWRTKDNSWSYEYQLKPMGILTSPKIWIR